METLTVSETSRPAYVAHAITWSIRRNGLARLEASGDEAVNQAMTAMALAGSYLAMDGITIAVAPTLSRFPITEADDAIPLAFTIEPVTPGTTSTSLQRQLR